MDAVQSFHPTFQKLQPHSYQKLLYTENMQEIYFNSTHLPRDNCKQQPAQLN